MSIDAKILADPEFWGIVGSISTGIGSLITGIAVIVAIKQYRQPITKRVRVRNSTAIPVFGGSLGDQYLCITIDNRGIVPVTVISVNLYTGTGKRIVLSNALTDLGQGTLPKTIGSGESFSVYVAYEVLKTDISRILQRKYGRVRTGFDDSQGDKHLGGKSLRLSKL